MTVRCMIVSIRLLGLALKTLPLGTADAIGPASARSAPRCSASCCSASPRSALRLACIALIVAGIVSLKLVSAE